MKNKMKGVYLMKMKYFLIILLLVLNGCAKKQVKDDEGGTGPMGKSRVGVTEIGYSGEMNPIQFEFDQFNLTEESRQTLQANADWLKKKKSIKVQIEGHCDNRGSEEYNVALGQKRADAVRNYLVDLGVSRGRVTTVSYGEEKPLDTGDNEEAWAKNRRAEFVITAM